MAINTAQELVQKIVSEGKDPRNQLRLTPLQASLLSLYLNHQEPIAPSAGAQLLDVDLSQISRANTHIITKITEEYFDELSHSIPKLFFDLGELKKFEAIYNQQILRATELLQGDELGAHYVRMAIDLSGYPNIRSILRLMENIKTIAAERHLSINKHHRNAIALSVIRRKFLSAYVWRQRRRSSSIQEFTAELDSLKQDIFEDGHKPTIYRYYNTLLSFHSALTHDYVTLKKSAQEYIALIQSVDLRQFTANNLGWVAFAYFVNGQYNRIINILDEETLKSRMLEKPSFSLMLYYFWSLTIEKDIEYVNSKFTALTKLYESADTFSYKEKANHTIIKTLISFFSGDFNSTRTSLQGITINNTSEQYSLSLEVFTRIMDSAISVMIEPSDIAFSTVEKNNKWFRRNGYGAKTYERLLLRAFMSICEGKTVFMSDFKDIRRIRNKLVAGTGGLYGKLLDNILNKQKM